MKKYLIFALCAVAMAFVACQKESVKDEEPVQTETHLTLNFTINHGEATKAVKSGWEYGDRIHIYFDRDFTNGGKYLDLEYTNSGGSGEWVADWSDGLEAEIAGKTSGILEAYYIPFRTMDGQESGDGSSYYKVTSYDKPWYPSETAQPTGRPVYTYFLQARNVAYTVSAGSISATFTMSLPSGYDFVHFFLEGVGKLDYKDGPRFTITTYPPINSITPSRYDASGFHTTSHAGMVGYNYYGGTSFTGVLTPEAKAASTFTFYLIDNNGTPGTGDDVFYSKTFTGKSLAKGSAIILPDLDSWDKAANESEIYYAINSIPSAVPMFQYDDPRNPKLKHVVYFNEYNLGADKKQLPVLACRGHYYAWGETVGYSLGHTFSWEYYSFSAAPKDGTQLTKYINDPSFGTPDIEGLGTLEAVDDAAAATFGGNWHIPSDIEWSNLLSQCDWSWDDTNKGFVVTARAPYAGNTIFLSQANAINGSDYGSSMGVYWSANGANDMADAFMWNMGDPGTLRSAALNERYIGASIRPVFDEIIAPMP